MTLKDAIERLEQHGYRVCTLQDKWVINEFAYAADDDHYINVPEWVPTTVPVCNACGEILVLVDEGDGWARCSACGMN